jgi:hypothetical protein
MESKERSYTLWLLLIVLLLIANLALAHGGIAFNSSYRVLIVEVAGRNADISEKSVVERSLRQGGMITVDVDLARKFEASFDRLYAVSDSEGKFLTNPALLNWVSDQGWELRDISGGGFIFVKRWSPLQSFN